MKKRLLALVLVCALVVAAFAGCSKDNAQNADQGNKSDVTLKWVVVGGGMPANYDKWQAHINEYLQEKIGAKIDVEVVSWGDWDNKRNIVINSGEYFDILFTDSSRYVSESNLGAFLDITELVKKETPALYNLIPAGYWDAVKVKGNVYAVPTYKDSSATQYMIWDDAIAAKYGIDVNKCTTLESLTPAFEKILAGEKTAPVVIDQNGFEVILSVYDQMSAELPCMGVRFDDQTRTVVNVLEQPDVLAQLKTIHEWYQKGIINADAPTTSETPSYRMFFTAQGWSGAAKTTWGPNMGVEATAVQFMDTIVSNSTVRGSLNAISSSSKHPVEALKFLELMNTDSYVRDAFYYGLEGDNFQYTADRKIEKLNSDWCMAGYTQGTFFNVSQLASDPFNQWDEVKQLNANAKGSVLLGFNFDTSAVENELAACRSVYNKYRSFLLTGVEEPTAFVAKITAELKTAGFDKVIAEAQRQVNENFK